MTITRKDRLFVTFAVPAALLAAYVWLIGLPLDREVVSEHARVESLGSEEVLRGRQQALAAKLVRVRAELASVEKAAAAKPESGVVAATDADDATRLANLCGMIRSGHIRIISCSLQNTIQDHRGELDASAELLAKIGVRTPATWVIIVEAPYRDITRLLTTLAEKRLPVIPETVAMIRGIGYDKPNFWKLRFCL